MTLWLGRTAPSEFPRGLRCTFTIAHRWDGDMVGGWCLDTVGFESCHEADVVDVEG